MPSRYRFRGQSFPRVVGITVMQQASAAMP